MAGAIPFEGVTKGHSGTTQSVVRPRWSEKLDPHLYPGSLSAQRVVQDTKKM